MTNVFVVPFCRLSSEYACLNVHSTILQNEILDNAMITMFNAVILKTGKVICNCHSFINSLCKQFGFRSCTALLNISSLDRAQT